MKLRILICLLVIFSLVSCGGNRRNKVQRDTSASVQTKQYGRYGDADPTNWSGVKPWNFPVHGIDISKFQTRIDWNIVRRSGIQFAFIKATEGGDHLDEAFYQNWRAAGRVGIKRGAYHFWYFCRPAVEQARWFIRNVPRTQGALPPVIDMEWNHKSPTCKYRPPAYVVQRELSLFSNMIERHYGQRPIIYATPDFYHENQLGRFRNHEFWLRSVAKDPRVVYPRQPFAFWQYTGTGYVPGITGKVDINVFNGSQDRFRSWTQSRSLK